MNNMFLKLWRDDAGFVVSTELVLVATIVVIGLIAGLSTVRDQVVIELADFADAISEIDQSYSFSAVTAHASSTAGTSFNDAEDFCDEAAGTGAQGDATTGSGTCLLVTQTTSNE